MEIKLKYIWMLAAVVFLLAGCEEKVTLLYENEPALYFFKGTDYTNNFKQGDSLIYSFYTKELGRVRDTVYLNIRTMGLPAEAPRAVSLVQANTGNRTDAIAGIHYVAFDDPEVKDLMVIPANAVMADIPVILLRDKSMKSFEFRLNLEIRENDYFKVGLDTQKSFLIRLSDMAAPPDNWKSWSYTFGEWGPVKMRFIMDYVGVTDFEKYAEYTSAELTYLQMKAIQKLEEYNQKNNTILTEDDGVTIVEFPN